MTIEDIAVIFDETVIEIFTNGHYVCDISGLEIKDGGCLGSPLGRGKSTAAARRDFAEQVNGKTLVKNAMRSSRLELTMPDTITGRRV